MLSACSSEMERNAIFDLTSK